MSVRSTARAKGPVLVTGAGGLLGGLVAWTFANQGWDAVAYNHARLDITDRAAVFEQIRGVRPTVVVHCAAMTNVDACETDPEAAQRVNGDGSRNVADAAAAVDAAIVHISSDYVFDGDHAPYTESSATEPIQHYGRSKLAGEQAVREATDRHFILRSAWIYGPGGKNFLSKLPELAETQESINAVVDQYGSPTYAVDLAEVIHDLVHTLHYGTHHVVNEGRCSFSEFCETAAKLLVTKMRVEHVRLDDLGRPAPRPRDTAMTSETWASTGLPRLRPWEEACAAFIGGMHP